jgi:N-acetylneuraminic acid mutarotase
VGLTHLSPNKQSRSLIGLVLLSLVAASALVYLWAPPFAARYGRIADSPVAGRQNTGQADAGSEIFNGNLYLVGGYGYGANDRLDMVSIYSPASGTWTAGPRYPVKAWGLACAALGRSLYCFGGLGAGLRVFKLEVDANSWTRLRDMPRGYNDSQGQVVIPDPIRSQILIMGSSNDLAVSNNTWAYQIDSDSYVRKHDMPQGNAWFTAAIFQGTVYTFGGSFRFQPIGNMIYAYDISEDSWKRLSTELPGPARYGMLRNPGVIGGIVPIVDGYASGPTFYNMTYFYDFQKDSFVRGTDTLLPRDGIAGGIMGHDLIVAGGRNVRGSVLFPIMGLRFTEKLNLDPYIVLA